MDFGFVRDSVISHVDHKKTETCFEGKQLDYITKLNVLPKRNGNNNGDLKSRPLPDNVKLFMTRLVLLDHAYDQLELGRDRWMLTRSIVKCCGDCVHSGTVSP